MAEGGGEGAIWEMGFEMGLLCMQLVLDPSRYACGYGIIINRL